MVQEMSLTEVDPKKIDEMEELPEEERTYETRLLRPLASFLELDVSRRPCQAWDRVSTARVYIGVFLGLLLICLGVLSNMTLTVESSDSLVLQQALPLPKGSGTFNTSLFFVGLGVFLIITRLLLLFYGREFFIGRNFAAVVIQKPFERSNRLADSLKGYMGVRYRSSVVNVLGLTSYTQHIIDLQHPNEAKTIPLYITRNGDGIRTKWKELALALEVPAIFNEADGITQIALDDLEKDYPTLIKEEKIPLTEENLYKVPKTFRIVQDETTCLIDPQVRDSAFSVFAAILCVCAFFAAAFFGFVLTVQSVISPASLLSLGMGAVTLFIVIPLGLFFRKRRLIISKEGIRVKSRWAFISSVGILIKPEEIDSINVIQSSYDLDYSLVIGADKKTTHIGRGISQQDLDWLENFMNNQIKRFMCS